MRDSIAYAMAMMDKDKLGNFVAIMSEC